MLSPTLGPIPKTKGAVSHGRDRREYSTGSEWVPLPVGHGERDWKAAQSYVLSRFLARRLPPSAEPTDSSSCRIPGPSARH